MELLTMSISADLLPEWDLEMASTRKTLERIPDDKFDWRPHAKSFTMGALASHVANLPQWVEATMNQDSFDLAPVDGPAAGPPPPATNSKQLLAMFDENAAVARKAIEAASDESYAQPWSLKKGGTAMFTMPRGVVLRRFFLSHIIHHRAQLGVYLRLNDIAVPAVYGPSADEAPF
jgi:uncharacterized damage-inducible protein DinB